MNRAMIAALAATIAVAGCTSSEKSTTSASRSSSASAPISPSASAPSTSSAAATDSPASAPDSPAAGSAVATSSSTPVPTQGATSSAPATGTVVTIDFAAGKVKTETKVVKIKQGSAVTLVVTSDVADEVHVHGYDIKQNVGAGATVRIPLTAADTGVFEVELEKSAALLVKLQIQ